MLHPNQVSARSSAHAVTRPGSRPSSAPECRGKQGCVPGDRGLRSLPCRAEREGEGRGILATAWHALPGLGNAPFRGDFRTERRQRGAGANERVKGDSREGRQREGRRKTTLWDGLKIVSATGQSWRKDNSE